MKEIFLIVHFIGLAMGLGQSIELCASSNHKQKRLVK